MLWNDYLNVFCHYLAFDIIILSFLFDCNVVILLAGQTATSTTTQNKIDAKSDRFGIKNYKRYQQQVHNSIFSMDFLNFSNIGFTFMFSYMLYVPMICFNAIQGITLMMLQPR